MIRRPNRRPPRAGPRRLNVPARGASPPKLLFSGQYDDPLEGSWGLAVDTAGAHVYRYEESGWRRVATGRWNAQRGRLEGVDRHVPSDLLADLSGHDVRAGLSRAAMADQGAKDALRSHLRAALGGAALGGRARKVPNLAYAPEGADIAFATAAAARCAAGYARRRRKGTRAALDARRRAEHLRRVARAAFAEVCGRSTRPIFEGTGCDVALSALEAAAPGATCAARLPRCDRAVGREVLSAWRAGRMPPIGPYELARPHAVGQDPCCHYHPDTQARLRLHREVTRRERLVPWSPPWVAAVRRAEEGHPLAAAWARCDAAMVAKVSGFSATGGGEGAGGTMRLLRSFYEAARAGEGEAARIAYARIDRAVGAPVPFEDLVALDAPFFDLAHREAHDTKNPGWIKWVHDVMRRHRRPIFHQKR